MFERITNRNVDRRTFLKIAGSAAAFGNATSLASSESASRLGLVTYCCRIRNSHLKKHGVNPALSEPKTFLRHCHQLNAGGMQIALGILDQGQATELRQLAEEFGMFIEAIISVPEEKNDLERFEASVRSAVAAGAVAARTTIIPGRRYEYFDSLEKFREYESRGRRALEIAAPVAEKHKLPIAVENHKDHRNSERIALFEHVSSEYVGACVDTGNSFALLEDPIETVKALAPWAHSVHLKDQALHPYEDGFLLADIPLGQGSFDLKKMVNILRDKKPEINFSLELITRDPLKVPVFSHKYWATFPDLPASELARTMRFVRNRATDNLQYITKMTPEQRLAREDANVIESLAYARNELGL